jgi:hypothetical protein
MTVLIGAGDLADMASQWRASVIRDLGPSSATVAGLVMPPHAGTFARNVSAPDPSPEGRAESKRSFELGIRASAAVG